MRVLITGGAGFIGSSLARAFRTKFSNAEIVAFDNLKRRGSELNVPLLREANVEFVHGDVRFASDLDLLRGDFDLLIDAAAEPSVQAGCSDSPRYVIDTNLTGTLNALAFAQSRFARVLLLSTSRVYSIDALRSIRLREADSRFEIDAQEFQSGLSPNGISEAFSTSTARSFYGTSKLAGEQFLQEFVSQYGLRALILRCSVVAGPGQFGKADQGVFTMWTANHYFKRPLQYTGFGGQGKQVRDLLHIGDLCDFVLNTVDNQELYGGNIFNCGGGPANSVSLAELTRICQTVTGNRVSIAGSSETSPVDVPLYISDCARLHAKVGWKPTRSVQAIVADTFEWIRTNESTLKNVL